MTIGNQRLRATIVVRAVVIWITIIVAEIAHGIARALILVPSLGEFRSNQFGVFTGSAIILGIAYLSIGWIGASRRSDQWVVGTIWLVLTVAFEMLFGRLVVGVSWERLFADYNMLKGGLMPLGLLVLFLAPWIAWEMKPRGIGTS